MLVAEIKNGAVQHTFLGLIIELIWFGQAGMEKRHLHDVFLKIGGESMAEVRYPAELE